MEKLERRFERQPDSFEITGNVVDAVLDGGTWSSPEVRAAIRTPLFAVVLEVVQSDLPNKHDAIIDFLNDAHNPHSGKGGALAELGMSEEIEKEWIRNVDAMVRAYDPNSTKEL
jgi:hypothetical protein